MMEAERNFHEMCRQYNDANANDHKGDLLHNAFDKYKYDEDLLAFYVAPKTKFDCLYGFLVTQTRIFEINTYTTMVTVTVRKYKDIKKVVFEREFEEKNAKKVVDGESRPERVQLKFSYVDQNNNEEEVVWESIINKENIIHATDFANTLLELQYDIK